MTPLFVRERLGGDARLFGLLMAAYGVGTVIASVGVAQLVTRRPGRVMFAFEILAALTVLAVGLEPTLPVVVASFVLMRVALSSSTVIWHAMIQRLVPARLLG